MMRNSFLNSLQSMNQNIIKMATLVGIATDNAIKALVQKDMQLADKVEQEDDAIDYMQFEIDKQCLEALIRHQPVAQDIRLVIAVLKITGEIERIGDQAADISHLVTKLIKLNSTFDCQTIVRMGEFTKTMLNDVIRSYIDEDLNLAEKVCAYDDEVNELFRTVTQELRAYMRKGDAYIDEGLLMLSIAKYFEKIGDHLTNVAEWIIYAKTAHFAKDRPYKLP